MQTIAKQERRALVDKAISFRNCQKEKGPSSPQWEENGGIITTNRFVCSVAGKSSASSRQIIIIINNLGENFTDYFLCSIIMPLIFLVKSKILINIEKFAFLKTF